MIHLSEEHWNATRYDEIIKWAKVFNVQPNQALAMRHKYIDDEIKRLNDLLDIEVDNFLNAPDDIDFWFSFLDMKEKMEQLERLEKMRPKKPVAGQITDDDVRQAREYPVSKLIEFKHGKATAFCHDDKTPSMFHGFRTNTAQCPVCDRKFGPIDILIFRDGYGFTGAVKELCQR